MKPLNFSKKTIANFLSHVEPNDLAGVLEDILTPAEMLDIHQRLNIVESLSRGVSQREVAKELGVSVAKVNRGSRILQFGTGKLRKYL